MSSMPPPGPPGAEPRVNAPGGTRPFRPALGRRWRSILSVLVLATLLVAGGALRLEHINWDQYQHVHPDERFIVWVADTIHTPLDWQSALDPERSTIDPFRWPLGSGDQAGKPRGYAYGHFPLYLLVAVADAARSGAEWLGETTLALPAFFQPLHAVGRHLREYNYLPLVGRAISSLSDLAVLLLVYGLGRRAYGRVAGLIAAAAYTFAVLPIQLSHFYAVDPIMTLCVVAAISLAARWTEKGGWVTWLGAGVMVGLAVGSKFSAVLLVIPLAVAACYRLPEGGIGPRARSILGRLAAAFCAGLAVFAVTNPFAFIEARAYVSNIMAQNAMVSGVMDLPYTRQYVGTLPYVYFVEQLSRWGLGVPLGIVAWCGLVWAVIRAGKGRAGAPEVVMLAWSLPYFATTGAFYAKFLRYMSPLLPFLLIFGAGMAVAGYRWLRGRWGLPGILAWGALAGVVAVSTVAWALAFTSIYRVEHTWVQASRWIYEHVQADAKLLTEHWDDSLPLTMDEIPGRPPPRAYKGVELPLYDPDTPEKLDLLAAELSTAQYVILASNRLYAPIQRLAGRYPMTSQYYRLLFEGGLGYRLAAEFSDYPSLGPITIPDQNADESFSVYDHPRVMIFANEGRLSAGQLRARLSGYLPQSQAPAARAPHPPGRARYVLVQPTPTPPAPAMLGQPVDTLPVVADFRWNRFASERPPVAIALWWLLLSLLGLTVWPMLFPLLGSLRDRGFGIAGAAGWLILGWVHWIGVSLGAWQNRTGPIALALGAMAIAGILSWRVQRQEIARFWARHRRLLLGEAALFTAAFLAFVGVRLLNPDLWQPWNGGEKFMESAFLNATLRSAQFPPYDPYFAGGTINYYYYGLFLVAQLIKLTGIAPEVAFNLAVPGLLALTAAGIFGVAHSLVPPRTAARPWVSGLLAVLLALLLGNLAGFSELSRVVVALSRGPGGAELASRVTTLLHGLQGVVRGATDFGYDYWASSRVIPETINEFPLWTFLFADLHPHMIAIPFGVLVSGLSLSWVLDGDSPVNRRRGWLRAGFKIALVVVSLGALGAINTWDLPTYFLLVAGALLLAAWRAQRAGAMVGALVLSCAIGALAVGAYRPFYAHYSVQVGAFAETGIGRYLGWVRQGSPIQSWLLVWGFWIFLAFSYGAYILLRRSPSVEPSATPDGISLAAASRDPAAEPVAAGIETHDGDVSADVGIGDGKVEGTGSAEPGSEGLHASYAAYEAHAGEQPVLDLPAAGEDTELAPEEMAAQAVTPGQRVDYESRHAEVEGDKGGSAIPAFRRPGLIGLLALVGIAALLLILNRPTAAVVIVPLGIALGFAFRRTLGAAEAFTALLMALGLAIVAGIELLYLKDFLAGGDWYRMNTVFKFAIPAWILLSLTGATILPDLWGMAERGPSWLRVSWRTAAAVLLAASLVFLPLGVASRVRDRFPGAKPALGTLDGTEYMTVGHFVWPDMQHPIDLAYDYLAVHWLLDHVTGTPVVAEAPAGSYEIDGRPVGYDYYRAGGLRVASLTGLPILLGQHQSEQRPGWQVDERRRLGQEFFSTIDVVRTKELARELRIRYIYVGQSERMLFPEASLKKFDLMVDSGYLGVAYRNPRVTIYEIAGEW